LKIGYFNSIIDQEWAVSPWRGAVEAARSLGVELMSFSGNAIRNPTGHREQGNIVYELATKGALDGAIVWKGHFTMSLSEPEIAEFLARLGVPVVTIEGKLPGYPGVTYDNYAAMKKAIAHLIDDHGIERIGYLGLVNDHFAFGERFRAYRDFLAERGLAYDESIVGPWCQWESLGDGGRANEAMEAWLRRAYDSGMRGLVGSCDPTAVWALERLDRIGVEVPLELAVVGFDGLMQGKTAVPRLSSVRPDWERLGALAVETVVRVARGEEVPPLSHISSEFLASQSCGCLDRNVIEAAQSLDPDRALEMIFGKAFDPWVSRSAAALKDALREEVSGSGGRGFIRTLNRILDETLRRDGEAILWQGAISAVRNAVISAATEPRARGRAESLCQQARVAVGNAVEMQKARVLFDLNDWIIFENELFRNLASTFDIWKLADILIEALPRLGIRECYLSLYEAPAAYRYPDPAPEWSRLVLAYEGLEDRRFGREGLRFRTGEIIPAQIGRRGEAKNLLVLPLHFEERQIGFIVFGAEAGLLNGTTYSLLASQISAGIRGTFLVNEVMEKDARLEAALGDLKAQHEQLEDANRMLTENQRRLVASEKMASLGRLTAGIAHELNTPLAAVRTSVEILRDLVGEYAESIGDPRVQGDDHRAIAADMRKLVDSALASAEKSAGFIRGIKGQTTNLSTRPAAGFAAAPVVADALSLLDFAVKRAGCEVAADLGEGIRLFGDPHELGQILTNLINNAVEACARGAGRIRVSLAADGEGQVVLKVADNGSGISPENLPKVFDPMFTTKPFGEGTGLGLSIVHELVEKFKGRVEIESEPGRTVFSVIFPAARED
jgi:signal transduction histidine kinase/DNA-binding LacI/PurR family transcriptional regulator